MHECLRCGSKNLEPGGVAGMAIPEKAKLPPFAVFAGARINCRVCLDCGHVDLSCDLQEFERLRKAYSPKDDE